MGPVGFAPSSSTATGVTKNDLTKIDTVVGSNGTVIPRESTNTEFTINLICGWVSDTVSTLLIPATSLP